MRKLVLVFLLLAVSALAQTTTPQNVYGGGVSYNNAGSPSVAGTGFWAHSLTDGTYSFTALDVLPNSLKPLTVTTNVSTGIAQKIVSFGKVTIYAPVSAGISWQGSNLGWSWTGGGMASVPIRGDWYFNPALRFAKSSVANGTGYSLIPGLYFSWGK